MNVEEDAEHYGIDTAKLLQSMPLAFTGRARRFFAKAARGVLNDSLARGETKEYAHSRLIGYFYAVTDFGIPKTSWRPHRYGKTIRQRQWGARCIVLVDEKKMNPGLVVKRAVAALTEVRKGRVHIFSEFANLGPDIDPRPNAPKATPTTIRRIIKRTRGERGD
jgi:hypothetical protein